MRSLAALAALVAASSAGAATSSSGLRGVVMRGPIVPVCAVEQPCDAPAKDVTLVFSRNGRVVRRPTTNDQGRYRVRLPVGLYTVRTATKTTVGPGVTPATARVKANLYRRVDFFIDTGIR
jgi:hypothetical protein